MVDGLSQENLDRRPVRGGWSVGEILDHLLKAEAGNRDDIARLIDLARSGRVSYIRRDLTPAGIAPAFLPRSLLPFLSFPVSLFNLFIPASVREALVRTRLFPASATESMYPPPAASSARPSPPLWPRPGSSWPRTRSSTTAG